MMPIMPGGGRRLRVRWAWLLAAAALLALLSSGARAQTQDCEPWSWAVYHDCPPYGGPGCELGIRILTEREQKREGRIIIATYRTQGEALSAMCAGVQDIGFCWGEGCVYYGPKGKVNGIGYGIKAFGTVDIPTLVLTCFEPEPDSDGDGVPDRVDSWDFSAPGARVDAYGQDCTATEAPPVEAPVPPPATYNPTIALEPEEGSGGSDAEAIGQGFPPDTTVEVRWDTADGMLVGEGQSDGAGDLRVGFVVPPDADEGEHDVLAVYDDAGQRRWVKARFWVRELCFRGQVTLPLMGSVPLQGVEVRLWWADPKQTAFSPAPVPDSRTGSLAVPTAADGSYIICSSLIGVPSRDWLLQVSLSEVGTGSFGVRDWTTVRFAQGLFGARGRIGADPDDVATWLTIESETDLVKDLRFEDLEDNDLTLNREDHALDSALVYYHVHQAMRVYQALGVTLAGASVPVQVYDPGGTRGGGSGIFLGEADSEWNSGDAPKNREWHELSHYVMWLTYGGRFPPLHAEQGDINGNHILDVDTNHGGYLGNALTSSDAITEGFAEFMSMVIADQMDQLGEPYMQDLVAPYIYTVSGSTAAPQLYNLELNHPQNLLSSLPQERRTAFYDDLAAQRALPVGQRSIWPILSDEENCVASLLWDLYDPVNEAEKDGVQLPPQTLWSILVGTYTFPTYYDGPAISGFLGDAEVFPGRWSYYDVGNELGFYDGERKRNIPYPTEARHIYYLKDLYDALVGSLPEQRQAVERIFASHKVTLNTYQMYEDYSAPGSLVLSTFGDAGSQALVALGPEAAYSFWGQGLVADVIVRGWGSGFTVGRSGPVDARAYLYLLLWMNAPAQVAFDVVLEDDAGQWLCPGTSEALYQAGATPADWPLFQQGTGGWGAYSPPGASGGPYPYAVVIAPTSGAHWASGWTHAYQCLPNPHYRTPPPERTGPNVAHIVGAGVLFKTPGAYRALAGGMVLAADYPWKPGMRTIYGMGDPAQGIWLPYRRDHPPLPGGKALVQLDRVPATVWVTYEYGVPYQDLSFQYPVQVTSASQEIGLYIEPASDGQENKLRISAQVEGYEPGAAVTLTSTDYWTMWDGSSLMQIPLVAGTQPAADVGPGADGRSGSQGGITLTGGNLYIDPARLLGGALCCGGVLAVAGLGVVLLVRRRRRRLSARIGR